MTDAVETTTTCLHEDRDTYQGVLAWECPSCGAVETRMPGQRHDRMEARLDASQRFVRQRERRESPPL